MKLQIKWFKNSVVYERFKCRKHFIHLVLIIYVSIIFPFGIWLLVPYLGEQNQYMKNDDRQLLYYVVLTECDREPEEREIRVG